MEESNLYAAGGRAIYQDPFLGIGRGWQRPLVYRTVILVEGPRTEVGWFDRLSYDMRLPDPGPLDMRQHDRDCVAR